MKSRLTPSSAALILTAFAAYVHHLNLGWRPTSIRLTSRSMRLTRPIPLLISRLHRLLARLEMRCLRWISPSWDTPTNASIPSTPDNFKTSAREGGVDDVRNKYLRDDYLSARYLIHVFQMSTIWCPVLHWWWRKVFTVTPDSIFQISSVLTRLWYTLWFSYKKGLEIIFSVSLEV